MNTTRLESLSTDAVCKPAGPGVCKCGAQADELHASPGAPRGVCALCCKACLPKPKPKPRRAAA